MSSSDRSSDRRSSASADDRAFNDETTHHNPERHLRVRTTGGRRTLVLESSNTNNKNTVAIPIRSLRDNGEHTVGDNTTYSFTLNGAPLTIRMTEYSYNVLTYTPAGHGSLTVSHLFQHDVGMNDDGRALHDAIATLRAHVTGPSASASASARSSDPRSHHSSSGSRRGAGAGAGATGTRRQQGGRRRSTRRHRS